MKCYKLTPCAERPHNKRKESAQRMATNNLGKVSVTTAGAWNSATTYDKLTIVSYNNTAYISMQGSTNIQPGSVPGASYWMQLVSGITNVTGPVSVGNVDTYTINYANGNTDTFTVTNGTDGTSPTAAVSKVGGTATITITDIDGTTTASVTDGTSAGFGTPVASANTVAYGNPASASVSASGPDTAKVFNFTFNIPQGAKGDTGNGLTILGYYPDLATLQSNVPTPSVGDAYGVGINSPYNIYIFDGDSNSWVDNGVLQGPKGEAATIAIGSVTGLPAGSTPVVTNTGDQYNATFNFQIPAGYDGNPGTPGTSAGFGTPSASATTLLPGSSATAAVSASGPDTAKVFAFSFGIPQGAKGDTGPNILSTSTATALNGMIKGNGSKVAVATAGTDYQSPLTAGADYNRYAAGTATNQFPAAISGVTTLDNGQRYAFSFSSSSRKLKGPVNGYASGTMNVTGTNSGSLTFDTGEIVVGETFPLATGLYFFDVQNGIWHFSKAVQY